MGLFDRILQLIRANLNSLVSQMEDPEKILEQTVLDMQDDLIQLRQAVAQAIATQKRTERQASQAESLADEWYKRAQLALQKGEETLAKEALARRKPYLETATALKQQLDQQGGIVTKLKQDMRTLEAKIAEAKTKKDMYIARARAAKATQGINDMMGRVNPNGAMQAFERMEEKVLQLEARSEAIAELNADDLHSRFAALESAGGLDADLAALKAEMAGNGTLPSLPSDSTAKNVDPELEKLRAQIERP